jgi:hypothetical protein
VLRYLVGKGRLTHLIVFGDFGNWESLSHWASLRAEQVFVEEDIELVNVHLAELEAITRPAGVRVYFLEGNHEAWATQLEAKYPVLYDSVNLKHRLRFPQRGWTWVPENHFLKLGKLYHTHGHVRGIRSPADMCKRKGACVMYGHTHTYRTESLRQLDGELAAWTIGCGASIDPPPPYARGEPPESWVHGFALTQFRANGKFQVGFRRIIDESYVELEDGAEFVVDAREVQRRLDRDAELRRALRERYQERFYVPGGQVQEPEPIKGTEYRSRTRRARVVRSIPDHLRR